ncbi:MAG TPA: NADH-quinone oxidoreductase subunit NuoH [Phycisphaerae bacterium]|nr:NADH-quinone oxidoreductase subunit NuoH [Phycisphaerae bacterium]
MSQISLPWVQKDPAVYQSYRRKAIRNLIAGGVALLAISGFLYTQLGIGQPARTMDDWRIIPAWLAVGMFGGGAALILGGLAVAGYRQIKAFLKAPYVAFGIFIGGIIAVCLIVWAHSWLFSITRDMLAEDAVSGTANTTDLGLFRAPLTVREIYTYIGSHGVDVPLFAYLLWPLQFDLIRDLVAVGGIVGFVSVVPVFGIWWERKIAGRMQSRLGPMRVGGWHGWAQSPADGVKLIFKEDMIPPDADQVLFRLAPYLTFIPPICAMIALPFAGAWVFRNLDVALLFILAMLGIEVVGVILAGWASNNKWSVYGAMREACQMVSYEIPMGMSLLIPVMTAGTLQLTSIADQQAGGFNHWFVFANPWCFASFFTYYIASLASCKRAPFDLPESESELVAGFHTEYSGFRWSLFFFGEYVAMFIVSGLAVILFLGGWKSPLPESWAPGLGGAWYQDFVARIIRGMFFEGPILFILKAAFLYYVQLWIRWTLPRIRIDQVLYACVQVLLPLTMLMLLFNTLWILGLHQGDWGWLVGLDRFIHRLLVIVGAVVIVAIVAIAAFGFSNRRRLVGNLVIDSLPGS